MRRPTSPAHTRLPLHLPFSPHPLSLSLSPSSSPSVSPLGQLPVFRLCSAPEKTLDSAAPPLYPSQEYYQAEMDMLNLVADMSHYDHTLYALAEHRWEEQVKVVPRLKERADLVRKQQ